MSLLAHPSLGLLASACGSVNFLLLTQRPEEHLSHLPCKVALFHTPTVALSPLSPVRSCVLTGLPAPTYPLPATHTSDSESDWKGKARLCCHLTFLGNPHMGPHMGLRTGPSTEPGFSVYKALWLLLPASGSSRMFYQPNYSSLFPSLLPGWVAPGYLPHAGTSSSRLGSSSGTEEAKLARQASPTNRIHPMYRQWLG